MPESPSTPPFMQRSPVTREALYDRVWTTPIQHLAAEYGVSGSYLARVCSALNVPRPPMGYWQKKAVGKDKPRPALPEAQPGDQLTWSNDAPLAKPISREQALVRRRSTKSATSPVEALHPLLRGTQALFRKTRKVEDFEYLRPYKQLLPDIVTSEAYIPKALEYAHTLYTSLERKGHRVVLSPSDRPLRRVSIEERETPGKDRKYGRYGHGSIWSPYRPTVTFVGAVPIGLALIEMTERVTLRYLKGKYMREDSDAVRAAKAWQLANSWTHEQDVPSGRFRVVAYSPYPGVEWQTSWQETSKRTLTSLIPDILRKVTAVADDLAQKQIEADEAAARYKREQEERWARWEREQDRQKVAAAREASEKQLSHIIQQWSAAMSLEQFFREAEVRISEAPVERQGPLSERLALARSMVGTLDPLDFLEGWIAPDERYKTRYSDD